MGEGVSVDLGSALPYLEDRLMRLFGKDAATKDWNDRLTRRMRRAGDQAARVQCIGMDRPISIANIYQPLRLRTHSEWTQKPLFTDLFTLLDKESDAAIFAGPGRGKTTLVSWVFLELLKRQTCARLLFFLRMEGATEELVELVDHLRRGKLPQVAKKDRVILLVDGYDEIDEARRKVVSNALADFRACGAGNFYLSCRTFYDVYDLKLAHYRLAEFSREDSLRFVRSFAAAYDCTIDADALLVQLEHRNLDEFARHPLMLTLVCMLKTTTHPELPQNALHLLKRAFDTLTFRWDEQKGVRREARTPLDGADRESCLLRIAYSMRGLVASQEEVERYTRQFLALIQRKNVDERQVLRECAQWYGVLVPADGDKWQFAHRSIHDYLAARFMVENGRFNPSRVRVWNSRAAYAACLSHDATKSMVWALDTAPDMHAFSECLYNRAPFDVSEVAPAVIAHFGRYRRFLYHRAARRVTVDCTDDFFNLASDQFLLALVTAGLVQRPGARDSSEISLGAAHDVVVTCALGTVQRRGGRVIDQTVYERALAVFGTPDFTFQIGHKFPYIFKLSDVVRGTNRDWRLSRAPQ